MSDFEVCTIQVTLTSEDIAHLRESYDNLEYGIIEHMLILASQCTNLELFDDDYKGQLEDWHEQKTTREIGGNYE